MQITTCSPEFTIRRISLKQPVFCLRDIPKRRMQFLRLDIEKFQLVNSFFGSSSGDGLLQYIAKEIRKFAGDTEQIAYGRIEADIFGICMPYRGEEAMLELGAAYMQQLSWTVPAQLLRWCRQSESM